jgi:hypothetical protein
MVPLQLFAIRPSLKSASPSAISKERGRMSLIGSTRERTFTNETSAPFMAGINDHYKRMTKDHLLTAVRYPNGNSGVYRVALMLPDNRAPIFSNEAYDAYVRALVHHDDSRLEKVFGKERGLKIKKRRDMDDYNAILERTKQVMRVQAVEDDDDDEYEETE